MLSRPRLHPAPPLSLRSLAAIINPRQERDTKSFSFDYSYWSHTSVTVLSAPFHGSEVLPEVS